MRKQNKCVYWGWRLLFKVYVWYFLILFHIVHYCFKVTKAPFSPGTNMHPGWSVCKWTVLSTSVKAVKCVLQTHCDPIRQTKFRGGLGCIWPHHICSVWVSMWMSLDVSRTATKDQLIDQLIDCVLALVWKYVIIVRLFGSLLER